MKKTLTINLGGIVFHIDEDAYDLLKTYLEKLKERFEMHESNEIIADIESRMAEIFNENKPYDKYVISIQDVQRVKEAMGNPEDIAGDESTKSYASQEPSSQTYKNLNRRIFRNPDDKILGGVCSGISAFLNIDPVWLRLLFALTVVFAGTGIMVYIILWIIIPEARTPIEKMQMRGEEINISNIEKNIRNEMSNVKDRLENPGKDLSSEKNKARLRHGVQDVLGVIGQIVLKIVKVVGLFIGAIISIIAIAVLAALSIVLFMAIGWLPAAEGTVVSNQFLSTIVSPTQLNLSGLGILLVVALPVVVLLLNGLKIIFKANFNLKKIGAILSGIWIIGIALVIYEVIDISKEFNSKAVYSFTTKLPLSKSTHIILRANQLKPEDEYLQDENGFEFRLNNNRHLIYFTHKPDSILCSDLRIDVSRSMNDSVYLAHSFSSRGRNIHDARALAQACRFNYHIQDSVLVFDDLFYLNNLNKYRGQHARITLKIPEGTIITFDKSLAHLVYYMEDTPNNLESDMLTYQWKMTADGLECLNCKTNKTRREPVIDNEF